MRRHGVLVAPLILQRQQAVSQPGLNAGETRVEDVVDVVAVQGAKVDVGVVDGVVAVGEELELVQHVGCGVAQVLVDDLVVQVGEDHHDLWNAGEHIVLATFSNKTSCRIMV